MEGIAGQGLQAHDCSTRAIAYMAAQSAMGWSNGILRRVAALDGAGAGGERVRAMPRSTSRIVCAGTLRRGRRERGRYLCIGGGARALKRGEAETASSLGACAW